MWTEAEGPPRSMRLGRQAAAVYAALGLEPMAASFR